MQKELQRNEVLYCNSFIILMLELCDSVLLDIILH